MKGGESCSVILHFLITGSLVSPSITILLDLFDLLIQILIHSHSINPSPMVIHHVTCSITIRVTIRLVLMNLLVRSLSPTGQQASASSSSSSGPSRPRPFRSHHDSSDPFSSSYSPHHSPHHHQYGRSYLPDSSGYPMPPHPAHLPPRPLSDAFLSQPHMVFNLDSDLPPPSPGPHLPPMSTSGMPALPSGRMYPWSRFTKGRSPFKGTQLNISSSSSYPDDRNALPSSSSPNGTQGFDYYEYFSNYGRLTATPSPTTEGGQEWPPLTPPLATTSSPHHPLMQRTTNSSWRTSAPPNLSSPPLDTNLFDGPPSPGSSPPLISSSSRNNPLPSPAPPHPLGDPNPFNYTSSRLFPSSIPSTQPHITPIPAPRSKRRYSTAGDPSEQDLIRSLNSCNIYGTGGSADGGHVELHNYDPSRYQSDRNNVHSHPMYLPDSPILDQLPYDLYPSGAVHHGSSSPPPSYMQPIDYGFRSNASYFPPPSNHLPVTASSYSSSPQRIQSTYYPPPPPAPSNLDIGTHHPVVSGGITPYVAHVPLPSGPGINPMATTTGSHSFRISFIETNVYSPLDVPTSSASPDNYPLRHRFHKHLHGEWVTDTVHELKQHFSHTPSSSILVNVEKKSKYPFIIFGPLPPDFDTRRFVPTASCNILSPELRINDGIYDICGSISRPGSGFSDQDDLIQPLGYVVSAFQTFPGEDSEKLEQNWITWTGAQLLYKYLPISAGLRRLVFYKRHDLHLLKARHEVTVDQLLAHSSGFSSPTDNNPVPDGGGEGGGGSGRSKDEDSEAPLISYVLLCECLSLHESILASVCAVIDQLRARCCGYSALYIKQ